MFTRDLQSILHKYLKFPVIAILGPRQSGKTTLAQLAFPTYTYVSLENPRTREFAAQSPLGFLKSIENQNGVIIDEFQYVPEILSYIQLDVDEKKRPGYFILTGSQNFLANQAITQSLAGRVGILTLLPLSIHELSTNNLLTKNVADSVFKGGYPRPYSSDIAPSEFYPSYIQTYIERDVRTLVNVGDLATFQKFLTLCAARVGNLLALTDIATICSISTPTARRWLSVLQASYIVFLLEPFYNNFNKRLTKRPKIYFYDTGLACYLMRLNSSENLTINPFWGHLFENFIIADLMKQYYNKGMQPSLYFWRDQNGSIEIDGLIYEESKLYPIEIKGGEEVNADYFKGLKAFQGLDTKKEIATSYVIYAGERKEFREAGEALGWHESAELITQIISSKKTSGKK